MRLMKCSIGVGWECREARDTFCVLWHGLLPVPRGPTEGLLNIREARETFVGAGCHCQETVTKLVEPVTQTRVLTLHWTRQLTLVGSPGLRQISSSIGLPSLRIGMGRWPPSKNSCR